MVRSSQFISLVVLGYMDRLVLHALNIYHMSMFMVDEVTILSVFMAPNRSIVTVTVKRSLFSFNLLHSAKSEICLLAEKKTVVS